MNLNEQTTKTVSFKIWIKAIAKARDIFLGFRLVPGRDIQISFSIFVCELLLLGFPFATFSLQHPKDIKPRKEVYLNVDLKQRGAGGDNSWGALPHKPCNKNFHAKTQRA